MNNCKFMLIVQRHCNSKLVVQEAELRCTPLWGTDHKSGGTLYPPPGGAAHASNTIRTQPSISLQVRPV